MAGLLQPDAQSVALAAQEALRPGDAADGQGEPPAGEADARAFDELLRGYAGSLADVMARLARRED